MSDKTLRPPLRLATATAALLALNLAVPPAHAEITGRAEIKDGDTLDIGMVRIRLHGIDAPEVGQTCAATDGGVWDCGAAAIERLAGLVEGRDITCEGRERDAYGRVIASCEIDGTDLGYLLVREGLAWAYLEYSGDYIDPEARARAQGVGIWQEATETAWAYREDRWARAAAEAPQADCPIKGNIGADGERIYHTPWSKYYGRTQVDEADGEAWFCDENEAEAAGFRAAGER